MKTIMIIIIFLLIGVFFIISNNNIKMDSVKNIDRFVDLYSQWIDGLLENGGIVSGYVVKMKWLPGEDKK